MPKVSHYNTVYLLKYTFPRYMKCLFTNIQKEQNMLKTSGVNNSKLSRYCFLNEIEHIVKSSNLHQCTFNPCYGGKLLKNNKLYIICYAKSSALGKTLTLERGLLEKRGGEVTFPGGLQFYKKNLQQLMTKKSL